ncbi:MAG: HAD-IA family hydrolase [Bryobacteraceae bacterium]|jgi:HAD superfamily hydrolase (TIGR01509 family)
MTSPRQETRGSSRGVALDLDGVIVDGMPFHLQAWAEAFSAYGIDVTASEIYMLEGAKSEYVVDVICSTRDREMPLAQKNGIVSLKRKRYSEIFRVVPLHGATTLIEVLCAYNYKLALVTGAPAKSAQATLQHLAINQRFSALISYETVSEGKPSAEPYLAARSMLSVPPENCLVIENAPLGIESAKSAGLPCLAVATYLDAQRLTRADLVLRNVEDCAPWFIEDFRRTGGVGRWRLGGANDA